MNIFLDNRYYQNNATSHKINKYNFDVWILIQSNSGLESMDTYFLIFVK